MTEFNKQKSQDMVAERQCKAFPSCSNLAEWTWMVGKDNKIIYPPTNACNDCKVLVETTREKTRIALIEHGLDPADYCKDECKFTPLVPAEKQDGR